MAGCRRAHRPPQIGGPGLAGILVAIIGAPLAVVLDAVSYLASAGFLLGIASKEPPPEPARTDRFGQRHVIGEIREGLRVTFGDPRLRAVAAEAATYNALYQMIEVVILLYLTRQLGLDPATIGILFATGAVGALFGSVVAGRLGERFGVGRALTASMVLGCSAPILLPLAGGSTPVTLAVLGASFLLGGFGVAISNVHAVSIRQSVTPDRLLGRMNASYRTLVYGAIPLGAVAGGLLGEVIGLRETLVVAAIGLLFAPLWVVRSPIPAMRVIPARPEEAPAAALT